MRLHICKYFDDSAVHSNLINCLAQHSDEDILVYVPSDSAISPSRAFVSNRVKLIRFNYGGIFKYFLLLRSFLSFLYINRKRHRDSLSHIFCHTVVVDGLIGFLFNVFYRCPYSVMVRNTDIFFYYKKFWWARWALMLVLEKARFIGFPSKAMESAFDSHIGPLWLKKRRLWVNGIDSFWHDSIRMRIFDKPVVRSHNVVFVGRFDQNKNLYNVIRAIGRLRCQDSKVRLVCIGGSIAEFVKIYPQFDFEAHDFISFIGQVDRTRLLEIFDNSGCLCVPSYRETFGLVYVEGLTRGVPCVLSKGQGVDGLFPESAVIPVEPSDPDDIARGICSALSVKFKAVDIDRLKLDRFAWDTIAEEIQFDLSGNDR
jgi:L-malate glycosyltransferase